MITGLSLIISFVIGYSLGCSRTKKKLFKQEKEKQRQEQLNDLYQLKEDLYGTDPLDSN